MRPRAQCAILPLPGVGAGLPPFGGVIDVAAQKNGDVIIGGFLPTIGALTVNGIARWDGAAWSPLGAGVTSTALIPFVGDITTLQSGDVVAVDRPLPALGHVDPCCGPLPAVRRHRRSRRES